MEPIVSIRPILAVLCPLVAAPMIFMLRRQPNPREAVTLIAQLAEVDPAAASAPASALADILSGLLEAEDHRPGA